MAATVGPESKLKKLCNVKGKEGDFYLLRKGQKNTRVIQVGASGEGELVPTTDVENEREVPKPADPAPVDPVAAITTPDAAPVPPA